MKVHFADIRHRNNGVGDFPVCYSTARLLDLDKGSLPTSPNYREVTCKRCRAMAPKHYPWASFARDGRAGAA